MQATDEFYQQLATGNVRPLSYQVRFAPDKVFDDDVNIFILDQSLLDGDDILASEESITIREWDKYIYTPLGDRVISVEWQREEEIPYSVNTAIADIVLNNYDNFFEVGSGEVSNRILPRRPYRILAGFGGENLPQFVGLSETTPKIERSSKTATVHCTDFLAFLFDKPLDQTITLEDVKTHEVLDYLFELGGLVPDQYQLDEGYNRIKFVYFEKGMKYGEAIKQLMQAELGSLYMDETGLIIFKNRLRTPGSPVMVLDSSNIVDYKISQEDTIINVVEIKSDVREVQASKPVIEYTGSADDPVTLYAGDSDHFFNFNDPVTSIQSITDIMANSQPDGSGSDLSSNISVDDYTLFANSIKITFTNSGSAAYLTGLTINGTPAEVTQNLYFRYQDDESVGKFEERPYSIDNNYIQSSDAAESVALSLLNFYKDYANTIELEIKGDFALQLADNVQVNIDDIDQEYTITKIVDILNEGKFTQRITGKVFNIPEYFILDESLLDGDAVLAP